MQVNHDSGRAASGDAAWYIGVDCGGTFTDLVMANARNELHVFKVPSVPADPAEGVLAALHAAAAGLDCTVTAILERCALLVHGSTVATNTVLEGKGARVGLIATAGFRDSLQIRRGYRANAFDHRTPFPAVIVPRHLRLGVAGRIDRDGLELEPLDEGAVAAAAETFGREGVESVAVCLFNSFLTGAHEQRALEVLRDNWPGEWAFASVDVAPILGEYERTSTAVMNAYVAPGTIGYLQRLAARLRELGLGHSMLLIQNNGGAVSVEQSAARPASLLLSGPAAGVGALDYYRRAVGTDDLISMEIGGTSCDVLLMSGGSVSVTDRFQVGGYDLAVPSVDVFTIGAGGGTIAGVDRAGLLYAGPEGAGAVPGPACYGLGGSRPTVTDAQLVLGRLRPGPYAGGSVTLDPDRAHDAIATEVAGPLGITVEEAAVGIIRLVEQNLLHAVQEISSERGHDPRRFVLVAAGGAGPMHGAAVGRLLGCHEVYVPRLSGVFCALGMLHTDVRHDFVRVHLARLDRSDPGELESMFEALVDNGRGALAADGFTPDAMRFARALDLRYMGQQFDLRVLLADGEVVTEATVRDAFEREHQRMFGHVQPAGIVEISKLRLVAIGTLPPLSLPAPTPAATTARPVTRRAVWLGPETGWRDTAVYEGSALAPGNEIPGPALIEERTTTILVGPQDHLTVNGAGDYRIVLESTGRPRGRG
ncbi:MAG: hydantoinase/oxoprolinase family protein [Ectothiorhodospiraceae bacterium]|nr:hydantoinase/oxoprolinase family protein [Ectothiorhodospiraceae bacterium]